MLVPITIKKKMNVSQKPPLFPLIRHLSKLVTPVLVNLPVSANQITTACLVLGLVSAWCVIKGEKAWDIVSGFIFVIAYILDNCDGEIARIKNQCTTFGMRFDTFVDWVVHTALFAGLGLGAAERFDNNLWFWLGLLASVGGTINYIIGFILDYRGKTAIVSGEAWAAYKIRETHRESKGLTEWFVFLFRELTRADFCFIFLALALFDVTWILVPAGAIGSQVYWITLFFKASNDFQV